MTAPARSHTVLGPAAWLILLVLTLASALAINPYYYGSGDNSITITFLKASIDPSLYPGDYMVAQRPYYYTYLWNALGAVHVATGLSLPVLFFATYLAALYLTFLGVYLIALELFARRDVAMLAMIFVMSSRSTFAGVSTIEKTLNTREAATPLLLLAIYFFLRRDALRSFLFLGLAWLVHPLTAMYVVAMLGVAGLVEWRRGGLRQLLIGVPVFVVVASPLLVWRARHTPPSFHLFTADALWLEALHFRSAHHMFPVSWGWPALAYVGLMLLLFGISWRHRNREREDQHRIIGVAVLTILVVCALGVVASDIHPMGIAFLTQPLRSFTFMEYFTMLYVAHYVYRRIADPGWLAVVVGAMAMTGGFDFGSKRHVIPLLAFVALVAFLAVHRRFRRSELTATAFAVTTACVVSLTAVTCYLADQAAFETKFSMVEDEESPYYDVERWARTHTAVRDGFIVPPYEDEEFRTGSERTVYADIEDGGLMNSNPAYGREWLRRMRMLGLTNPRPPWAADTYLADNALRKDYCGLERDQVERIAREMAIPGRRVFLVWPCKQHALPFPQRYRNDDYVVYEVG